MRLERATGEGRQANHPNYSNEIGKQLAQFQKDNPGFSPTDAAKFVRNLVQDVLKQIENNPSTKINDLFKTPSVLPADNTRVVPPPATPPEKKKKPEEEENLNIL